jgi:hypothetical protein
MKSQCSKDIKAHANVGPEVQKTSRAAVIDSQQARFVGDL